MHFLLLDIIWIENCFLTVSNEVERCLWLLIVCFSNRLSIYEEMYLYEFLHTGYPVFRMLHYLLLCQIVLRNLYEMYDSSFLFYINNVSELLKKMKFQTWHFCPLAFNEFTNRFMAQTNCRTLHQKFFQTQLTMNSSTNYVNKVRFEQYSNNFVYLKL